MNNNLGCGKLITIGAFNGHRCGVANAWGSEHLCDKCDKKLREKWAKEDSEKYLKNKSLNKLQRRNK